MAATAKKIISINLVDSHPTQARLGEYLRSQRDTAGAEIKDLVLAAVGSYYDPLAIGDNPNSTPQQIEAALIDAVFALTDRRNRLLAHCECKYGVRLSADCKLLLGLGSNLQAPTVEQLPKKSLNKTLDVAVANDEDEVDEADDEDDNDPYEGMTDDEYFAATKHLVAQTNIV